MKIVLCTMPSEPDLNLAPSRAAGQLPVPPKVAIVYLIKWMERHGYTSDMYDYYDIDMLLPTDEELEDYFKECQPTVVGLSAVVSTSYSQVKRISRLIRRVSPRTWIVCGGNLAASANLVLRKTEVDVCVVGDGEIPWVEFLDYVKEYKCQINFNALGKIKALSYLNAENELQFNGYGARIPPSEIPYPDYDILTLGLRDRPEELRNYFRKGLGSEWFMSDPRSYESHRRPNSATVWTSKGCVARCTFCQRSIKGYRVGPLPEFEEHLILLKEKFNVGFIHILDENFGSSKRHTHEVAKILKKHDMLWICSGVRCTSVTYEDVKLYKDCGCSGLKYGVESGSQKILDLMEKNFTVQQVYDVIEYCDDLNVYSPLAVMVGMPGDTNETILETGKFLGKVAYLQNLHPKYMGISIFYALPLPGTPLYEYGRQVGVIGRTVDEEERFLLRVSGAGAEKRNYVNLNGAKIKDLLFWDWLVSLEASRIYQQEQKQSPREKKTFMANVTVEVKESQRLTLRTLITKIRKSRDLKSMIKNRLLRIISSFLEKYVVGNTTVDRLPRWLVYGVVKYMVYFEFLLQNAVLKILNEEIEYSLETQVEPIDDSYLSKAEKRRDRSLRNIVNLNRNKLPVPQTLTEKNQQILGSGL